MNFEYEKLKIILGSGKTLTNEEMLLAVNRVLESERKQQMSDESEKGLGVLSELTVRQLCCAAYSKIDYGDGVLQNLDGKTAKDIELSLEPQAVVIADKPTETTDAATRKPTDTQPAWSRRLALPFRVDAEKANAKFTNGILRIELPKAEKAGIRHIAIEG